MLFKTIRTYKMQFMKILKNKATYEILTSVGEINRQLKRIEKAGRTCYQSEQDDVTKKSAEHFVRMLLKRGHESVIEHTYLTVKFKNLSRGFTHEMVRHRLAAYSQESTRYVDYAKRGEGPDLEKFELKCVVPPHRNEKEKVALEDGREMNMEEMFEQVEMYYRGLRKAGWVPQDARQILPIGIAAELVVSANWREWRHIFKMRTSRAAHWEIRSVMVKLLKELKGIIPVMFEDFADVKVDPDGIEYYLK